MQPPFLKKFDFRGIYNQDITDKDAYYLALALKQTFPLKKILLGWDTRASSKNLAIAFISALKDTDIEIYFLDVCPIDFVTAGANAFDFDLSIMFTGSHHPWNWTGLLIHTKGGMSLSGDLVSTVIKNYMTASLTPYNPTVIDLKRYHNFAQDIEKIYAAKIRLLLPLHEIPYMHVLVDVGDGSGYKSLEILETLLPQVNFTHINDRHTYDEQSSHTADPSEMKNMQSLLVNMQQGMYTVGFAFDSDADRVLGMDETGAYINGSLFASAIVETLAQKGLTTQRIGYAVDCGPSLANTATSLSLTVSPIPVGRSLVRQMLFDNTLDVGAENVGHFYLKDFFMTDSGVFAIALMLYWMSQHGKASTLFSLHPDGMREQTFVPVTPETKIKKEKILTEIGAEMEKIKDIQVPAETPIPKEIKKIEIDGMRYELLIEDVMTSWIAIRQSGYESITKYYFGSLDEKEFAEMQEIFLRNMK